MPPLLRLLAASRAVGSLPLCISWTSLPPSRRPPTNRPPAPPAVVHIIDEMLLPLEVPEYEVDSLVEAAQLANLTGLISAVQVGAQLCTARLHVRTARTWSAPLQPGPDVPQQCPCAPATAGQPPLHPKPALEPAGSQRRGPPAGCTVTAVNARSTRGVSRNTRTFSTPPHPPPPPRAPLPPIPSAADCRPGGCSVDLPGHRAGPHQRGL